ncbi:MAG: hypothetical protein CW338_03670 [Clostridiales bacterium]|nr:hypothetical protein [Clostridiales bacterium]
MGFEFITWDILIIACLLGGVSLVVLEVFLPGFGLPGISGCILLTASIVLSFIYHGSTVGLIVLFAALALCAVSLTFSLRSASKGKLSKSALILKNEEESAADENDNSALLGKEGTALTVLRPAGMAEFEGVKTNVVSDGEYIEKGARVVISQIEGARIVVKPL